jgi:hypothetical protein
MLVAAALTMGLPLYWHFIYATPVDIPVALSPAGSVTTGFNVPHENVYRLRFAFAREGYSNQALAELIGETHFFMEKEGFAEGKLRNLMGNRYYKAYDAGKYIGIKTGTPITICWEIRDLEDNAIIHREHETIGIDVWDPEFVIREISSFRLSPGKHELKAVIIGDVPSLSGIRTHLQLIPDLSKDHVVFRQLLWFILVAVDMLFAMTFVVNLWRNRTKAE